MNMTVVFETMAANSTQAVAVSLGLGHAACANGGSLQMWSTNATVQFAGPVSMSVALSRNRKGSSGSSSSSDNSSNADTSESGCSFSLELPPASIITVTTSRAGSKLGEE